jgi:hypothetical protein
LWLDVLTFGIVKLKFDGLRILVTSMVSPFEDIFNVKNLVLIEKSSGLRGLKLSRSQISKFPKPLILESVESGDTDFEF